MLIAKPTTNQEASMITTTQKLTFEEYLTYDDGTDTRYELVEGQLVSMTPATWQHYFITHFIFETLLQEIRRLHLPWMIFVEPGQRTGVSTSRIPDLAVIPTQQLKALKSRSAVSESPVLLAIEVVSPSLIQDDYITKRDEYQATGIPEYWVVDAISDDPRITIHTLHNQVYELQVFRDAELLTSPTLPELKIAAAQILNA
ncbi:Uma2 family endonuclease [Thermosynechococcaceae cyanobacterium BACA0444]|uniref:Uma2 family endonuclease n=1 Tax=Pseudocalidococcus azoricus BACA0444 TaxID=2918990 RepID=A0AAE4FQF8_9CYAN|nr:Uma2 family endonuclease [Pseudocalidococcus azoricus]MDS3860389.1 Uma2 family endonuclease [Pseudocalidococcus azoricus BACA0444]